MARPRLTYLSEEDRRVRPRADRARARGGRHRLQHAGGHRPARRGRRRRSTARRSRAKLPWELVERCLATCPRAGAAGGARPAARRRRRATGRSRSAPTAPARTCSTTSPARARRARPSGCAAPCASTTRCPRWTTPGRPSRPATSTRSTAGLEIEAISLANLTKHVQDEVRDPAHAAPLLEIFEAVAGGSLWDRPDLLHHQLHGRAAPARARDDRGDHGAGQGRRAGAGAADAAQRHDRRP